MNKKAARVAVNISQAFFHWVGIAVHPDLSSLMKCFPHLRCR